MRPVVFAAVGAALWLAGCTPKPADTNEPDAPPLTPPPAAAPTSAPPAPAAEAPDKALIDRLNGLETMPDPTEVDAYFSADLAEALRKDMAAEESALGYDYRWNAQDFHIVEQGYEAVADGPGRGRVMVRYTNFGKPGVTTYDLCRRPDGQWRIYDVRSNDADDGSVRHALGLERGEVGQC